MHDDIDIEEPSGTRRPSRRHRRWVAGAGAAAVLTATLIAATAPTRDGTLTSTEQLQPTTPPSTVPADAVTTLPAEPPSTVPAVSVTTTPPAAPPSTAPAVSVTTPPAQPATPPSTVPAVSVTTPPAAPERLSESSRLRLDGIGPVTVGMTLDEASAAAGMPVRMIPNSDLVGTGRRCAYARPEGGPENLSFMTLDGRIVRIDVGNSQIRTLSGAGTGSTEAELQATYPGRLRVEPNPYTGHRGGRDVIYVADEASAHLSLLFQVDGGRVNSFRSGLLGAVMAPEGCS